MGLRGHWRPVIVAGVEKFFACGILDARVRSRSLRRRCARVPAGRLGWSTSRRFPRPRRRRSRNCCRARRPVPAGW